jgi:uncharacterized membrane-anchored protein
LLQSTIVGAVGMSFRLALTAAAVALFACSALAEDSSPEQVLKTLNYRHGHIEIAGNIAQLELMSNYVYLSPSDAAKFLTQVWRNPKDSVGDIEGMILPTDASPLSDEGWAIVLTYDNSGHVNDRDASSIDYDQLLQQMQKATNDGNEARIKAGYQPIVFVGWAEPPHYDATSKTIYWAKRLRFGNDASETLNYFIRVLGRTGVLELNLVASSSQLALVNSKTAELMKMVSFRPGSQYAEYKPGSDATAAYGIAGLIAGGILVKTGFFKGLLLLLAASWKVVAVGVVAVLGAISSAFKKMLGRNRDA